MEEMLLLLFLINNVSIIPYKPTDFFFFFSPDVLGIPCPVAVIGLVEVTESELHDTVD